MAVEKPERMTADVRAGLLAPYDNWANRVAIDRFVRDIPFSPRHPTWQVLEQIEAGLPSLGRPADPIDLGHARLVLSARVPRPLRPALAAGRSPPAGRLRPLRRRRRPRADRAAGAEFLATSAPRTHRNLPMLQSTDNVNDDAAAYRIGQCATLACLLEATAPKVGNVHRGADFDDLTFTDFAVSAVAIGPAMEAAAETRRWPRRAAMRSPRRAAVVATNTNLGMVLLIAPLAAVPRIEPLTTASVGARPRQLTPDDCRLVYEAIRLAQPGGLGKVESKWTSPTSRPPTCSPRCKPPPTAIWSPGNTSTTFASCWTRPCRCSIAGRERGWSLTDAIVHTHLQLIAGTATA